MNLENFKKKIFFFWAKTFFLLAFHGLSIMDFENFKKKFFFFYSYLQGKIDHKPLVFHNTFQKFEANYLCKTLKFLRRFF